MNSYQLCTNKISSKKSNSMMLVQKITLFCVQEEMNQDHDGENMVAK